jgi:hypothetical protein
MLRSVEDSHTAVDKGEPQSALHKLDVAQYQEQFLTKRQPTGCGIGRGRVEICDPTWWPFAGLAAQVWSQHRAASVSIDTAAPELMHAQWSYVLPTDWKSGR